MKQIPFHGEFSQADASSLDETDSQLVLYKRGRITPYTLLATDQVVITDIAITVGGSALTVTLYDGDYANGVAPDAGSILYQGNMAANQVHNDPSSRVPHYCQLGTYPKVKASGAGQLDVVVRGEIRNWSGTAVE